jgi:hypothetical protein
MPSAVSQPPLGIYASPVAWSTPFFKSPQSVAALKHGILQRYVVVFASKTRGNGGGEVISMDMPGRYETGDSDVAGSVGSGTGHAHLQARIRGS